MNENRKEVAQEVPVQEQPIKSECSHCHNVVKITKICSKCNWGFDENANYCGHCGNKL